MKRLFICSALIILFSVILVSCGGKNENNKEYLLPEKCIIKTPFSSIEAKINYTENISLEIEYTAENSVLSGMKTEITKDRINFSEKGITISENTDFHCIENEIFKILNIFFSDENTKIAEPKNNKKEYLLYSDSENSFFIYGKKEENTRYISKICEHGNNFDFDVIF